MERVVFDTNVWISGLLWRGKPYQCLLLVRAGVVRRAYCPAMLRELVDKLREKFGFSANRIQAARYGLTSKAELVEITGSLRAAPEDPADDKFLECALVSGVPRIVSGDTHLPALREYQGIKIVSAAEFLVSLEHRSITSLGEIP